jgi:hypothetical protein
MPLATKKVAAIWGPINWLKATVAKVKNNNATIPSARSRVVDVFQALRDDQEHLLRGIVRRIRRNPEAPEQPPDESVVVPDDPLQPRGAARGIDRRGGRQ